MARLLTKEEVVARYGDPTPYILPTGRVSQEWEKKILTTILLPAPLPLTWGGKALHTEVHHDLAPELATIFNEIYKIPDAWASIGDYGGCYMWRAQRDAKVLSRHAWGIAVDLDTADNPFRGKPAMDLRIIAIFERHGWVWGGNWSASRRDPQHFERGA